jgi:hypothetical protein
MTNEIFNALSQYENIFIRVKSRQYQPYPGRAALQDMVKAIKEVRPNYHTNLGCSSCVRSLVLECAGMYFTEKDIRQKALDAATNAAKNAQIPNETEQTGENTTPKKKARKTKKDA